MMLTNRGIDYHQDGYGRSRKGGKTYEGSHITRCRIPAGGVDLLRRTGLSCCQIPIQLRRYACAVIDNAGKQMPHRCSDAFPKHAAAVRRLDGEVNIAAVDVTHDPRLKKD